MSTWAEIVVLWLIAGLAGAVGFTIARALAQQTIERHEGEIARLWRIIDRRDKEPARAFRGMFVAGDVHRFRLKHEKRRWEKEDADRGAKAVEDWHRRMARARPLEQAILKESALRDNDFIRIRWQRPVSRPLSQEAI